jgi:hypothetical protein
MAKRKSSEKTINPTWFKDFNNCAVIVAHPDDETLWAGGTILMHPETRWTVVTLCRKSDRDRTGRFLRALEYLQARGEMGDLDDGPEQMPLVENGVKDTIMSLVGAVREPPLPRFDLIITHSLCGEYTRHKRHEETAKAVCELWKSGRLPARQMWMFAYEDGGGKKLPEPIREADFRLGSARYGESLCRGVAQPRLISVKLSDDIWRKKYHTITKIYGFGPDSFEAKATGREEAFWCFGVGDDVMNLELRMKNLELRNTKESKEK